MEHSQTAPTQDVWTAPRNLNHGESMRLMMLILRIALFAFIGTSIDD